MAIKVLNLYAGIGGNRKLWPNKDIVVTAVEIEPSIARAYKHFFPRDNVIIGDAHKYLLEHYKEFDFIWSSPPCPSHSKMGFLAMKQYETAKENKSSMTRTKEMCFPDMKLYEEIIFLKHFFKGLWVVENTKSYYEPLINPFFSGKHYFWANFHINNVKLKSCRVVDINIIKEKEKMIGFNLDKFSFRRKDQILNNCVEPKLGLHVFDCAFREKQKTLIGG